MKLINTTKHLNTTNTEDFDEDLPVGRVLSRRQLLGMLGAAGLFTLTGSGSPVTASASGTTTGTINLAATPQVTEGPFFADENLNRSDLIAGTTRASVISGLPVTLRIGVYTLSGGVAKPLSGAQVDIWHADAIGVYSDEADGQIQSESTAGQTWLRGYQVTDASGMANFRTIYPGWYQGRTAHIHFKVRTYSAAGSKTHEFTSQFFFDDTVNHTVFANAPYSSRGTRRTRNANNGIYSARESDGTMVGSHLMLALTSSGSGYAGAFNIGLVFS